MYFVQDLKEYISGKDVDASPADIQEVVYRIYNQISKDLKRCRISNVKKIFINLMDMFNNANDKIYLLMILNQTIKEFNPTEGMDDLETELAEQFEGDEDAGGGHDLWKNVYKFI